MNQLWAEYAAQGWIGRGYARETAAREIAEGLQRSLFHDAEQHRRW